MSMPKQRAKPPATGYTDVYLSYRSTPEYADWLSALARATHRSRQEVLQCSVAKYSLEHGHPCGAPPSEAPADNWLSVIAASVIVVYCTLAKDVKRQHTGVAAGVLDSSYATDQSGVTMLTNYNTAYGIGDYITRYLQQ